MGRPAASPQNKHFGAFFANIVTVASDSWNSTVTRSGVGGVFWVFAKSFPELVRQSSRNGLTQLEFNKILGKNDFPLIRKRTRTPGGGPPKIKLDFFPTSSFRFAARRWRDPDNEDDFAYLETAWPVVASGMKAVSFDELLEILRQAIVLEKRGSEATGGSDADDLSACGTPKRRKAASCNSDDDSMASDVENSPCPQNKRCRKAAQREAECEVAKEVGCAVCPDFDADKVASTPLAADWSSSAELEDAQPSQVSESRRPSEPETWVDADTFLDSWFRQERGMTPDYSEVLTGRSRDPSCPPEGETFAAVCSLPASRQPSPLILGLHSESAACSFDHIADEALEGVFPSLVAFDDVFSSRDHHDATPELDDADVLRLLATSPCPTSP